MCDDPHMLVVITGMLPNAITTGPRSAKTKKHFEDTHLYSINKQKLYTYCSSLQAYAYVDRSYYKHKYHKDVFYIGKQTKKVVKVT